MPLLPRSLVHLNLTWMTLTPFRSILISKSVHLLVIIPYKSYMHLNARCWDTTQESDRRMGRPTKPLCSQTEKTLPPSGLALCFSCLVIVFMTQRVAVNEFIQTSKWTPTLQLQIIYSKLKKVRMSSSKTPLPNKSLTHLSIEFKSFKRKNLRKKLTDYIENTTKFYFALQTVKVRAKACKWHERTNNSTQG